MIYIIHIGARNAEPQHAIGYCAEDRLKERLREHARGKGSRRTKAALEAGLPMYLARVLPLMQQTRERSLRRSKRVLELCQFCCPLTDPIDRTPYQLTPKYPLDPPTWDPIEFRRIQHLRRAYGP